MTASQTRQLPGGKAKTPTQIPFHGWRQVIKRAFAESGTDNVSILAGGVAFFGFLAVFPTLIAALTFYGLFADPAQVTQQMNSLAGALPADARNLVRAQLTALSQSSESALTIGLAVSLLVALWSSSSATSSLLTAINIAYDEQETRGFVKLRAVALGFTISAIVFVLIALALIAVVPIMLDYLGLGPLERAVAQIVRWTLLIGVVIVGLAVVYRIAPDRNDAQFRWVTPGALVAAALWVLGSTGFSLYVSFFGNYNKTYGALAGVIVLLLWLYLTSYTVLLGAEINAESERQTVRDSTIGRPMPMGQRGAVVADTQAGPG
jgi:membrane protein